MSWLVPLQGELKKTTKPPNTSRSVVVNGKRYPSVTTACRALGVSSTKLYRMLAR